MAHLGLEGKVVPSSGRSSSGQWGSIAPQARQRRGMAFENQCEKE